MPKAAKKQLPKEPKTPVKANLVSPELLKKLVHNDEEVRNEAVTLVKQLISTKRLVPLEEFQKLWKGLWFTLWHSDTPLIQQALARDLADLIKVVDIKNEFTFIEALWSIILREFEFLDKYRINKFYLFVRFQLCTILGMIAERNWDEALIKRFNEQLLNGALHYDNAKYPHNLRFHLIDIYMDELERAMTAKQPSAEVIRLVLHPVLSQADMSQFGHIVSHVKNDILTDDRLVEWGVIEPEEPEEESEWEGFD